MTTLMNWFRRLIDEPHDLSLDTLLAQQRTSSSRPRRELRARCTPFALDTNRFEKKAEAAPL